MSEKHKQALSEGRQYGRTVQNYLDALSSTKPKRGRKRTQERVKEELAQVEAELPESASTRRLILIQKRRNLTDELEAMATTTFDIKPLEEEFVKVAKPYSANKGITYFAWTEFGVAPAVLKKAGITRNGNGHANGNGDK